LKIYQKLCLGGGIDETTPYHLKIWSAKSVYS
jgi:hypothetical protein